MVELWRAGSEPSTAIVDPSLRWRARLLASLMLVGIPLTIVFMILTYVFPSLGTPVSPWIAGFSIAGMSGCYGLARSRYWRVGAWLAVAVVWGATLVDIAIRGQAYQAMFWALAITLAAMVLRKRDTALLVALTVGGFLTMPQWAGTSFAPMTTVLIAGFFVLLGLVLGISMGVRGAIERQRLDALAKSEARFRGLLEVAFEGLVELKDGRIVQLNPGFLEITGRTESQLLGRELSAILQVERAPGIRESHASHSHSHRPGVKEASGTRPNGDVFYVELVTRVLTGKRGPIEYVAVRDITEGRQAQLQLSIAHRAVALGTLSAGIAHEINNPLSWMMTNLQMAQDELRQGTRNGGRLTSEQESLLHTLDDALQGGRRVISIVRDLKTMSREGNDQGSADVHAALDLACRIASRQIETRARLVRDYGHVPSVRGSAGRLGQVFLNLLTNAAQAIPEGQRDVNRITLRTRHRDGQVEISIRDTGRGIPRKVLPHIFDPFYTTKGKEEGTGLGLSITRSVVDGMGGSISVESREGDGATFILRLPVADRGESDGTASEPTTPSIEAPAAALGSRVRVLIVDDEPLLGKSLRRALHEHDVVFTEDPARALELCSETDFDVIVCDLMMPVISGEDVYEHLSERAPELAARMIFMTGGAFTAGAQRFLNSIENPVLNKPFTPNDLRIAVKRMLERHAA